MVLRQSRNRLGGDNIVELWWYFTLTKKREYEF